MCSGLVGEVFGAEVGCLSAWISHGVTSSDETITLLRVSSQQHAVVCHGNNNNEDVEEDVVDDDDDANVVDVSTLRTVAPRSIVRLSRHVD